MLRVVTACTVLLLAATGCDDDPLIYDPEPVVRERPELRRPQNELKPGEDEESDESPDEQPAD